MMLVMSMKLRDTTSVSEAETHLDGLLYYSVQFAHNYPG